MRRITSIETVRALAMLGVIFWHTDFLATMQKLGRGRILVDVTIYLVWWICLPYFFIVSGYFFGKALRTGEEPTAYLRRYSCSLASIFLMWLSIYVAVPNNWLVAVYEDGLWQPFYTETLRNFSLLVHENITLFLHGLLPVWHLWFLPALLFSLATLTFLAEYQAQRYLLHLVIGLYALAITPEISMTHPLRDYAGHLTLWSLALLFSALGWWLAGRRTPSASTALGLIVGGYALALIEGAVMKNILHSSSHAIFLHCYLGGIVLALGIFMLALAKPNLGQSTPLPFLAQFNLGVYLTHILIIYMLVPISWRLQGHSPAWQFVFSLGVYGLAVLFTFFLSTVPIARYLVMRLAFGRMIRFPGPTPPPQITGVHKTSKKAA